MRYGPNAKGQLQSANAGSRKVGAILLPLLIGVRLGALRYLAFLLALVACLPATELGAETLGEAVAAAYERNPRIESARSRSLATNESVPIAQAGALPNVSASLDAGLRTDARAPSLSTDRSSRPTGYDVTVTQPLFDGGRTSSAVRLAKANVGAERESVRIVVQQVVLASVTAYLDVVQDRRLVQINNENVTLLARTLEATRRQAALHEATLADLAQSEAALAGAKAQLELAKSNLAISEANFEEATLHPPGRLERPPGIDHMLPSDRQTALGLAELESPSVVVALLREQAAQHAIDQARAQLFPTIRLQAAYQRRNDSQASPADTDELVAKAVVSIPLYAGGAVPSEIRAARHSHVATVHDLANVRAQARTGVAQAWSRLAGARATLTSVEAQLAATEKALAGIKEERRQGQRTVLELINAQQAVLAAKTAREQIGRNRVVAAYTMLGLVGRLDPMALAASGTADSSNGATWRVTVTRSSGASARR